MRRSNLLTLLLVGCASAPPPPPTEAPPPTEVPSPVASAAASLASPVLIRVFISAEQNNRIEPHVPELVRRFTAMGSVDRVEVHIVDPDKLESSAEGHPSKFGITPMLFSIERPGEPVDVGPRYLAAVVEARGEFEVLPFDQLIEAKATSPSEFTVSLPPLEERVAAAIRRLGARTST